MKYYLIAGEASGDLHASNLMKSLKKVDPNASFRIFGGDLMEEAGGILVKHYKEMAFMGLIDVLANLKTIGRNLDICKKDIFSWQPDVVILVDYAGFNLRVAEYVKNIGIKVIYYISPKVWAWRKSRIEKLKKFTDKLFVIFPFEIDFFHLNGMDVEYYGNPLMDSYHQFCLEKVSGKSIKDELIPGKKIIALLAGSRKHEVKRCLPPMLRASMAFPEYQFVVAGASSVEDRIYRQIMSGTNAVLIKNQTYSLLDIAEAAVVTSGTATLETAIFKVPQVVIYKTSIFNFIIGRPFIRITFFSLVNLIAEKEVVKELLQFKLASSIRKELGKILQVKEYKAKIIREYKRISMALGEPGTSERIAERIVTLLKEK